MSIEITQENGNHGTQSVGNILSNNGKAKLTQCGGKDISFKQILCSHNNIDGINGTIGINQWISNMKEKNGKICFSFVGAIEYNNILYSDGTNITFNGLKYSCNENDICHVFGNGLMINNKIVYYGDKNDYELLRPDSYLLGKLKSLSIYDVTMIGIGIIGLCTTIYGIYKIRNI